MSFNERLSAVPFYETFDIIRALVQFPAKCMGLVLPGDRL